MGQTASLSPAAQMQNCCCQPKVSGDTVYSPVSRGRIGEHLPTLLSTPTAGDQKNEKKEFDVDALIKGNDGADDSNVAGTSSEEELILQPAEDATGAEGAPGKTSVQVQEVNAQVSDASFAEIYAADGPNRATGPGPTQEAPLLQPEPSLLEEADGGAASAQEQPDQQPAPPAAQQQPAKRTREERKELRRQQRVNAKERLSPFLTKNGFAGPNTPRRRLFRTQFPIHAAVNQNNAEVVKLLIIAGVDITKCDSGGRTAQELARREHSRHNSHAQVLALLTEAQRRRAARMARKSQAAEAVGATTSGEAAQKRVSSEASTMTNFATTSTASTLASTQGP